MYKKCLYLINIFVIYILTFSLTLPTTKQSVPRFQRSLLDELEGVDENYYFELPDDYDYGYGSLFYEHEEENLPTTVAAENGNSKTEPGDYNTASTMLSKTKPVQPTTGLPIEENKTKPASRTNSITADSRSRTSEGTTTSESTTELIWWTATIRKNGPTLLSLRYCEPKFRLCKTFATWSI